MCHFIIIPIWKTLISFFGHKFCKFLYILCPLFLNYRACISRNKFRANFFFEKSSNYFKKTSTLFPQPTHRRNLKWSAVLQFGNFEGTIAAENSQKPPTFGVACQLCGVRTFFTLFKWLANTHRIVAAGKGRLNFDGMRFKICW